MHTYKITWADTADKDGNRAWHTDEIQHTSLHGAIDELVHFNGIDQDAIIKIDVDPED